MQFTLLFSEEKLRSSLQETANASCSAQAFALAVLHECQASSFTSRQPATIDIYNFFEQQFTMTSKEILKALRAL